MAHRPSIGVAMAACQITISLRPCRDANVDTVANAATPIHRRRVARTPATAPFTYISVPRRKNIRPRTLLIW